MHTFIHGNTLTDKSNRLIAQFPDTIEPDQIAAYQNLFAIAPDLLTRVQSILDRLVSPQFLPSLRVGRRSAPDAGTKILSSPPSWLPRAIQTVARALGSQSDRYESPMLITDLAPLWITRNSLKDDGGTIIANISDALPEKDAQNYLQLFAASVDLLDIIDYISFKKLDEIKKGYEDAREFSKHQNLPLDVPALGVNPPIIPDDLEADRQLVARAKGNAYEAWH